MSTPRHLAGTRTRVATRAAYARTPNNFLVNDPDGFPSANPPVSWVGNPGAVNNGGGGTWWIGLDSGGGATPIGPNGPWVNDGAAQPVVTRATSLIVGPLSAAPFRVQSSGSFGEPVPAPRWVTDPMLLRPDGRIGGVYPAVAQLPRGQFWGAWIRSAIWWGLGVFLDQPTRVKNPDGEISDGPPTAGTLRLVDPRFVTTTRGDDGVLRWSIDQGDGAPAVFDRDGFIQLGPIRYRITVLRNPHSPVDAEGLSLGVFAMSPAAFALGSQVATYTAGQFRTGIPNGYLKVETPGLSQPQADALKTKWLENHGGDRRSIAVLNSTTSFTPINLNPVDAALAEVKRLSIADVAFAFGLDPTTLNVSLGNSATYNNVRDAWLNHRDYGLSPWITSVQDVLSSLLPGTQGVMVALDQFANPPAGERFAAYAAGIDAGILTPDEARFLEGLPPLAVDDTAVDARAMSVPEVVQKVYLGVVNGVITRAEARAMVNDAGGNLDVDAEVPEARSVPPALRVAPTSLEG